MRKKLRRRKSVLTTMDLEFIINWRKGMRRFGFGFIFLLFVALASAQTPEWVYQYENPDFSEVPYAIAVDSFGNSYTTGYIGDYNGSGLGIIKLDVEGVVKWIYYLDTLGMGETGRDIVVNSGRVYVVGYTQTGTGDLLCVCVDTSGQSVWLYLDTLDIEGLAIAVSPFKNVYLAGKSWGASLNWVVIKLDSLGQECWRYVYDGPGGSYDEANSIVIDGDENVYVGGYSTGVSTDFDFTVIKLDSSGVEQWVYRYDGPAGDRDEPKAMGMDIFGNIYIGGWSWGIGSSCDFCVVKIDSSGTEQWVYRYDGLGNAFDYAYDLVVDDLGNVYVCGGSAQDDLIMAFTVIGVDSDGNERWCYLDPGSNNNDRIAQCLILDGFGNIYASGFFRNYAGRAQIGVVKLDSSGNMIWTYIHPHIPPSPWDDVSRDIVADISGNVYLAGKICVSNWDDDIVVFKFSGSQGVEKEVEKGNLSDCLYSTIFQGGLRFIPSEDGELRVYDVMGKMVVKDYLKQNKKVFCPLSSGVYFVQFDFGKEIITEKAVVIR